jgi:hypothetical protein
MSSLILCRLTYLSISLNIRNSPYHICLSSLHMPSLFHSALLSCPITLMCRRLPLITHHTQIPKQPPTPHFCSCMNPFLNTLEPWSPNGCLHVDAFLSPPWVKGKERKGQEKERRKGTNWFLIPPPSLFLEMCRNYFLFGCRQIWVLFLYCILPLGSSCPKIIFP